MFSPQIDSPTDTNRAIWVGNYLPIKRLNWLVEIIQHTPWITFDIVLPSQVNQNQLFHILRCLPNVFIHNNLSQINLAKLYSRASVLISTSEEESFGLSILEAMACGTPALIPSSIQGANDFFRNEKDGLTYSSPSEATAILKHTNWQRMSLAAFLQARKFTWNSCARKTLELYSSMLN